MIRLLPRVALLLCLGATILRAQWHDVLARITVYDAESCSFGHHSSTGVRLRAGRHCAVDPHRIPCGSRVIIPGLGERLAIDTGTDVIGRKAARLSGRNAAERDAIVVDIFVDTCLQAAQLEKQLPLFTVVRWNKPPAIQRRKK
jgi:hypothetical protein